MEIKFIILYGIIYFLGLANGFLYTESFIQVVQNVLIFMIILLFIEIIFTLYL